MMVDSFFAYKPTGCTYIIILCITYVLVWHAGFVVHLCLVFATVTWFLHMFHFFLGIAFPFWSRFLNEQSWKIRLHIVEISASIVLCSLAPTVFVSVSQYTLSRFPPLFARPSRDVSFYTIILPLAILLAIGLNLMIYSLIGIHKVRNFCFYVASRYVHTVWEMWSYFLIVKN